MRRPKDPAAAVDAPRATEQERICRDLDRVALAIHRHTLDDAGLDALARAFESRAWQSRAWQVSGTTLDLDPVRIGGEQYGRLRLLLADAVHARGGSYRAGGITWRSDGSRVWAEPAW